MEKDKSCATDSVSSMPWLGAKHSGMKISASGVLNRVTGTSKFGAQEMLRHLNEMADRFYGGDMTVVDEFLQLYCLDDKRP